MAKPRPVRTLPEQIAEIKSLLDEERKGPSLGKLEAALNELTTVDRNSVEGLDDVEAAIENYKDIQRSGLTPEEYGQEKEAGWEEIETALEDMSVESEGLPGGEKEAKEEVPPPEFTRRSPSGMLRFPAKKAPAAEEVVSAAKITYSLWMTRPDIVGMPTPVGIWHFASLEEVNSTIQEFLPTREAMHVTGIKVTKQAEGGASVEIARIENVDPATSQKYRITEPRPPTAERAAPPPPPPPAAPAPPPPPTIIVRPPRGGFMRPFGCGEFIRAYLSGNPEHIIGVLDRQGNSLVLPDPARGAAIDDVRAAYKSALQWQYAQDMSGMALGKGVVLSVEEALRRIPQRLTKVRSHSFHRYWHMLKQLKWVEATGEEEPSDLGGRVGARVEHLGEGRVLVEVPQPRRFYRLAPAGTAASVRDWADPLVALYGYSQEERRGTAPPLLRPGTLPHQKAKGNLKRGT